MATYPFMTLNEDFAGNLAGVVRLDIAEGIRAGVMGSSRGVGKMLADLARMIDTGVGSTERAVAHARLAKRAQRAVLNSYAQVVTAQKRTASYRQGDRLSGRLRQALASSEMWRVDEESIDFINTEFLDREAAHWARLNAGALGIGRGSNQQFQVRFSGIVVGEFGLNMAPSPAFRIPRGYWFDGSQPVAPGAGPAAFYLAGTGPRAGARSFLAGAETRVPFQSPRIARGIRARRFLDTGVRVLATELGPTYTRLYQDLFDKRIATVRPSRISARVTSVRIQISP